MKGLLALLVLIPSISLGSQIIVTPSMPSQPPQREVSPPNVHAPNQRPVIIVPGVAGNSHGQRVIVVPKHHKRAHNKRPKVIINNYASRPGYHSHTPR